MISFRGISETAYMFSATSVSAPMPTEAQAGDLALAFYIEDTASNSTLDGWELMLTGTAGGNTTVMAWWKQLTAADLSSQVTITSQNTGNLRRNLHVAVYSQASVENRSDLEEPNGDVTEHTAPAINSGNASAWVVNFFAERASPPSTTFTLDESLTQRSVLYSDGSNGTVSSIVGDQANVGTGQVGSNSVTGDVATNNQNSSTVLLYPISAALSVNVSANQTVTPGALVTLNGIGGGGTGAYTYQWSQMSGPTVELNGADTSAPTFTAPDTVGSEVVFELEVNDGQSTATNTTAVRVASALLLSERFNGGTNGEPITTTNSAFTSVDGNVTRDDDWSVTGQSAKFDSGAGARASLQVDFPAASRPWLRWYPHFDAIPGSNVYIASMLVGTTQQADVRLNSDGTLSIRDHFSAVDTSSTVLEATDTLRLAWQVNAQAGTQTLHIYAGANVHGTVPTETLTGAYSGAAVSRVQVGIVSSVSSWTYHVDDVVIDAAAEPGPSVTSNVDVSAGSDRTVEAGEVVELGATISGGTEPYGVTWSQVSGPAVSYDTAGTYCTFIAPQSAGVITFGVTVTDDVSGWAYDEVVVTVRQPFEWTAVGGQWVPRTLHSAVGGQWV